MFSPSAWLEEGAKPRAAPCGVCSPWRARSLEAALGSQANGARYGGVGAAGARGAEGCWLQQDAQELSHHEHSVS